MTKQKTSFALFKLLIFFYMLWGCHAWFTWFMDLQDKTGTLLINTICFCIAYNYKTQNKIRLSQNSILIFAFILFIIAFFWKSSFGPLLPINFTFKFYPIYVLLSDRKKTSYYVNFIFKSTTYILIGGIILYLYSTIGTLPPGLPINYGDNTAYVFYNYFFMLVSNSWYEADTTRFFSIFTEPGYAGTFFAFILYITKYNYKRWETYIITIGLILTMSLGGFLCALVGYVFFTLSDNKSIKKIFLFIIIVIPAYIFGLNYNNGQNYINTYIIQRLQPDEDKTFSGNNRNTELADNFFEKCVEDGNVIFGIGKEGLDKINGKGWEKDVEHNSEYIRGSGYKMYLIQNGIIYTSLYFLFYYLLGPKRFPFKNDLYIWGLYVFFIMLFLPTCYPTSTMWLVAYVLAYNYHLQSKLKHSI